MHRDTSKDPLHEGNGVANSGSTHQLQATNPNAPFLSSVESNSSQTASADPLQLNHVVDYIFIGFSISRPTTTVRTPCIILHDIVSVGLNNFRINLCIFYRPPYSSSHYPTRACAARGKAIGFVCLSSVINTKIARSGDLGI